MECDICSKDYNDGDDFLCATCTRSSVYLPRIELARTILENDRLNQQVTQVVDGSKAANTDAATQTTQEVWLQEMRIMERNATKARTQEAVKSATGMREEIEKLRSEVIESKKKLAVRRKALEAIGQMIPERRTTSINALSEIREKGMTSFNTVSNRSAHTRAFLCREAAALLRLRLKKRQKNGAVTEQYSIAGLPLPDFKEINNIRCTDLTASLISTTHLLVLVGFYLGVRLPAEITSPYRDYPLPTINTPANSYLGHKTAFPGSGSINTAPSSPFSSKHDIKGSYRPRPLFIGSDDRDEKVAQLAKRDPTAFNFFVEGVALLAWDIAWPCRTQGFSQGTNSWEDICDIGRNLHQLILGQPQSPALLRVLSSRDAQRRSKSASGSSTPSQDASPLSFAKLGQASHLSAHAFLGQSSFNEQSRTWKFSKYNTIADSLKKFLITEMNNAEWELLEEQEWDDGGEQFDEAVLIKTRPTDGRDYDEARSIMTTRTNADDQAQHSATERDQVKPKGTSGWTKVKSRNDG